MDQHFGITVRYEHRPLRFQFAPDVAKVINLAIIGNDNLTIGAGHRLRATAKVDDRQAAMTKPHALRSPYARAIRPAMRLCIGHRPNARGVNGFRCLDMEQARNRAHGLLPPRCREQTFCLTIDGSEILQKCINCRTVSAL